MQDYKNRLAFYLKTYYNISCLSLKNADKRESIFQFVSWVKTTIRKGMVFSMKITAMSVKEIKELNGLASDVIFAGQVLKLPD